ncbi:MAG: GNAT family N-acetyltransferase [Candidatus Lokiarchaeota archaeon]|nr:GNAT family N-acetyltransferase [Candidatus Harpocratesius repetitus]
MQKEEICIRQCTLDDIDELLKLRRIMFESMSCYSDKQLWDKAISNSRDYFLKNVPSSKFIGWIAIIQEKQPIGAGGLVVDRHPPGPSNLSGKIGYIMNIVVIEEYRRQGIGEKIMRSIIAYLKKHNISVATLHATDIGKSLYQKLGFKLRNDYMEKRDWV